MVTMVTMVITSLSTTPLPPTFLIMLHLHLTMPEMASSEVQPALDLMDLEDLVLEVLVKGALGQLVLLQLDLDLLALVLLLVLVLLAQVQLDQHLSALVLAQLVLAQQVMATATTSLTSFLLFTT